MNEISITTSVQHSNDFGSLSRDGFIQITQTGTHFSGVWQTIGTSHELLDVSADVGEFGVAFLRNRDETNFVEIGRVVSGTFYAVLMLKPGECYPVRFANDGNDEYGAGGTGVPLYARADTAPVILEHCIWED